MYQNEYWYLEWMIHWIWNNKSEAGKKKMQKVRGNLPSSPVDKKTSRHVWCDLMHTSSRQNCPPSNKKLPGSFFFYIYLVGLLLAWRNRVRRCFHQLTWNPIYYSQHIIVFECGCSWSFVSMKIRQEMLYSIKVSSVLSLFFFGNCAAVLCSCS